MRFAGVLPILQTPFAPDGSADWTSMAAQVEFLAGAGLSGCAWPGFASEWWKLSDREIEQGALKIIEAARGRIAVILNVTAQSTYLAVEQVKYFASLGCDGLMCLPPFVVPRMPQAVLAHLEAVAAAAPVPQILQYSASLTGVRIDAAELAQVQQRHPHLTCIKVDFLPPGPAILELRQSLRGDAWTYLAGFAGLHLPEAMAAGAHGLMGGAGHAPEDLAVFQALQVGQPGFDELLPLLQFEMQSIDQSIATHKWLLKERGVIRSAHVRKPGPQLAQAQQEELAALFGKVRRA